MTVYQKSPELANLEDAFSFVYEVAKNNPDLADLSWEATRAIGRLYDAVVAKEQKDYYAKRKAEVDAYWGRVTEVAYGKQRG